MTYTARFVVLPAHRILNLTDPQYLPEVSSRFSDWWDPKYEPLREMIQREYISRFDARTGHYSRLEESIQANGILNPIFVTGGLPRIRKVTEVPPPIRDANLLVSEYLGGSRLYIAQRLGIDVPCILSDFHNKFREEKLSSPKEVLAKFANPSDFYVEFRETGVYGKTLSFCHMEKDYRFLNQTRARHYVVQEVLSLVDKWVEII